MAASLFERLGGREPIAAVVDDFLARSSADSRISPKLVRTDIPRLRQMLIDQVCEAGGGPCTYRGRSMKETHAGMAVTTGEFNALVEDLVASLDHLGVGAAEQQEILGVLGPMQADIVEIESTATGTPLPAGYRAAPPL